MAERAASYGEEDRDTMIERLEREMREAAANLDFETAARLRDQLFEAQGKERGQRGAVARRVRRHPRAQLTDARSCNRSTTSSRRSRRAVASP